MADDDPTTLHFDLSFVEPDTPCVLHVGTARIPLGVHDETTRTSARAANCALAHVPDERLTHHAADLRLPADLAQLLLVTTAPSVPGASLDTLLLSMVHVPRAARTAHVARLAAASHPTAAMPHPKLARFAATVSAADDPAAIVDVHDFKSAEDAAASIVFHHQELVNVGGETATAVLHLIEYSTGFSDLASQIYQQALAHQGDPATQNWAFEDPYLDTNMQPTSTSYYNWSDTTKEWMKAPLIDAIRASKNEPALESTSTRAGLYTVQEGTTSVSAPQPTTPAGTPAPLTPPLGRSAAPTALAVEATPAYWTLNNLTPHHGLEVDPTVTLSSGTFSLSATNNWLRWLSGYVQFLGPDGDPVVPEGWVTMVPGGLAGVWDSDTKKYVTMFSSVDTILAIPIGGEPTEVSFPWPANAASVQFLAGGIGRTGGVEGSDGQYHGGWDGQVCLGGALMTGIFNFGIPTACLIAGATVSLSGLNELAKIAISAVLDIGTAIAVGPVGASLAGGSTTTMLVAFADLIPRLLLEAVEIAVWMSAEIAEGVAEEATPIFGWIALAVSVASDVALLLQTTVEVALSPATFTLTASRSVDATWTLLPDVEHQNTWPLEATHFQVDATFTDGTTRSTTGQLTGSPQTGPITVTFDGTAGNRLPAGGTVTFSAKFYSETGWLAGAATSAPLSAAIAGNLLTVPTQAITEFLVPLTASTVYQHDQTLAWDTVTQTRTWGATPSSATVHDLSSSNVGSNLAALTGITVSQQTSELAYAWEASGQGLPMDGSSEPFTGQQYAFQGVDVRSTPQDGLSFVPEGFATKALVAFDLEGAPTTGRNVWVDPRAGAYHVRPLTISPGSPFDVAPGHSWGRFNEQIDSAFVHPAGYVVGVNTTRSKIEVLRLAEVTDDASASIADVFSGYGTRAGLVHSPVAVAGLPGSGFVVLEAADSTLADAGPRVQAFDFLGNPAPVFGGSSPTAPVHDEPAGQTLLDLAIETKGFMYVLKYLGDGSSVDDYRLDLYSPDGSWLSQTAGVAAGRLCVDVWRTAYTLDFGVLVKPDGSRTEPSVSIWLPSTP